MTTHSDVRPLIGRRALIGGALAGAAGLVVVPQQVSAEGNREREVEHAFAVLLKGIYKPAAQAPDLGLSGIDLNDGSYSTVPMFPVSGIAGSEDALTAVGDFYVQFNGNLCAYDLPGGALSMQFIAGAEHTKTFDDGAKGSILQGTWELTVLDATGIFRHFKRGHNHMLDNLHFLASGDIDEYCVCFIRRHR
ncbi:MAG TPA: hypothetical protein VHN36_16325 [Ilumatobacteraceae bacterium]|nr:hypothetical protein [Ilumatobacteraceae bacterium]